METQYTRRHVLAQGAAFAGLAVTEGRRAARAVPAAGPSRLIQQYRGTPRSPGKSEIMARVCQVTGKRPVTGNNVSHAKNRTRRRFLPNLHNHRFWLESEKRFVTLRVSSKGMRIIDKKGIETVLAEIRARGEKV